MNFIKVFLWGKEIGRLAWDARKNISYFIFNPDLADETPDIAPLIAPKAFRKSLKPIYGDPRGIYHKLPPFLADSLPDYWGSILFEKWIEEQKLPRNLVTPLYRLTFMGNRGMGAFEFEPCAEELNKFSHVDIQSLYSLSKKIVEEREASAIHPGEDITMQSLLQVGTSAGGRQRKAIIAIHKEMGEIRSGQIGGLEDYDYFILKFGDEKISLSEIEMAYYEMAIDAGIEMESSRLLTVDGINHFLTKRFDRKEGKKILMQTLAAINPDALSYEDLFATGRTLDLTEKEIHQLYRRLVFNVLANNTDDHIKNFSFLLEEGGRWRLSPAYDITFIFNPTATGANLEHVFSLEGKILDITRLDLINFARKTGIRNPESIIDEVAAVVSRFPEYAEKNGVRQPYRSIIQKRLEDILIEFGYRDKPTAETFSDIDGKKISDFRISINTKGFFEISVKIDGKRQRRFVKPTMPQYEEIQKSDIYNLSQEEKQALITALFLRS